jgi:GNAT superfamily N-acetyltransferase
LEVDSTSGETMTDRRDAPNLTIRPADADDVPVILGLIRELADYEKMSNEVVASEESLKASLFGDRRVAEVLIGELDGAAVTFAVFFHNFSTFLGRHGLYLEDLYVKPEHRGKGFGRAMLSRLAQIAVERHCGRLEWAVLDWNEPAIGFYRKLGAVPMDEWTVFRITGQPLRKLAGN